MRLDKPWRKYLKKQELEEYPIWVWDDENEGLLPLSKPSYEYGPLFIKAHFKSGVYEFDGYLVGSDKFYAFGLFVGDFDFLFNFNLPKLIDSDLQEIFKILGCKPFPFFPVRYKADVCLEDQKEISGVFEFPPYTFT